MTLSRRQVRELLDEHGVTPSRALGQHFVADPNTVRRIARLAGVGPGDRVVEVGPGFGSLTLALAETGAHVTAIELDRHLLGALRSVVEPAGVRVLHGDALRLDWDDVLRLDGPGPGGPVDGGSPGRGPTAGEATGRGSWALVANLPYNIATPLVLDVLARVPAIERMLVMVQREVGERLAAHVGERAYGIPSAKLAWWADAEVVGSVPPSVFIPQPRVESALVRVRRHDRQPAGVEREGVFHLIEAGFRQRRKMLRRSLSGLVGPDDFARAGVRPEARAEELALDDWVRLAAGAVPR